MAFVARTHPQQGYNETVDDRATTWEDFLPWQERFQFTVDAAASPHNAKLDRHWTRSDDGLTRPWAGERVWCNPPYSTIRPWVEKAWTEWGLGVALVVIAELQAALDELERTDPAVGAAARRYQRSAWSITSGRLRDRRLSARFRPEQQSEEIVDICPPDRYGRPT